MCATRRSRSLIRALPVVLAASHPQLVLSDCDPPEARKLAPQQAQAYGAFGYYVAHSGDTIAISSLNKDMGESSDAGAVDVFVRNGGDWVLQATLVPSDSAAGSEFGTSVALDGDTLIVGARWHDLPDADGAGAAYVFQRVGGVWVEQARLTASDPHAGANFGVSAAVRGDVAIVGAHWATTANDDRVGAAYVFRRTGTSWTQTQKLIAGDATSGAEFGASVALEGDVLVVGANFATGAAERSGAAYVFGNVGDAWVEHQKLFSPAGDSGDVFGHSVAVANGVLVIGAYGYDHALGSNAGAVFVFEQTDRWVLQSELVASDGAADDWFGHGVATDGVQIVVGAYLDDHACQTDAGAVYLFRRNGSAWSELRKLCAPDGGSDDHFGYSVAVAPGVVVTGAGDDDYRGLFDAGSGYVFNSDCVLAAIPGDLNCDGLVNNFDIDPFVMAIGDIDEYFASFPGCRPANADVNGDGCVNNFDIDPFVVCVSHGGCP